MSHTTTLHITRASLLVFWLAVVGYTLTGVLPNHAFQQTKRERQTLLSILPQGWAFFTRNAQEPVDWYYVLREGTWHAFDNTNASPRNWFGIKKDARIRAIEMAGVLAQIRKGQWSPCRTSLQECLATGKVQTVATTNVALQPTVCENLLIERQPPVPWAWARLSKRFYMPSELVRVSIRCARPSETTRKVGGPT